VAVLFGTALAIGRVNQGDPHVTHHHKFNLKLASSSGPQQAFGSWAPILGGGLETAIEAISWGRIKQAHSAK